MKELKEKETLHYLKPEIRRSSRKEEIECAETPSHVHIAFPEARKLVIRATGKPCGYLDVPHGLVDTESRRHWDQGSDLDWRLVRGRSLSLGLRLGLGFLLARRHWLDILVSTSTIGSQVRIVNCREERNRGG